MLRGENLGGELLDIFDENMRHIGTQTREHVHNQGLWHKTFHCWVYRIIDDKTYVLFQKRQITKDTFPGLLDISAAGHLLAGENECDGIREMQEELGVSVSFEDLIPAGVFSYQVKGETFIEHEFAYVFFYKNQTALRQYIPQEEEVSGIFEIELNSLMALYYGKKNHVNIDGLEYVDAQLKYKNMNITKSDLVPHEESYYRYIFEKFIELHEND